MANLTKYLATLTAEQLAGVLKRRVESVLPPEPTTLTALAARLGDHYAVGSTLLGFTRPEIQLLETIATLDDGCRLDELAEAVGVEPDDPDLGRILKHLAEHAVAWLSEGRVYSAGLDHLFAYPHGLGAPLSILLGTYQVEDLRKVAATLEVTVGRTKAEIVSNLTTWLSSGENVRRLVAGAPRDAKHLLESLARQGPAREYPGMYGARSTAVQWAIDRALACPRGDWTVTVEMPREVGLALRGPNYRRPFDPAPPVTRTVPAHPVAVEREAAAAASTTVARVAAIMDDCALRPISILKTGGVGIRELRRLAKNIADTVEHVRLWLELAEATGLIGISEAGIIPATSYDEWRELAPAEQLCAILQGWQVLTGVPLSPPLDEGPNPPAFYQIQDGPLLPTLREAVLGITAALPTDAAIPNEEALVELTAWTSPIAAHATERLPELIAGVLAETHVLGLVAHNTASSLGRALATADLDAIHAAAAAIMPVAQTSVLFQADLTAVCTGTPTGALSALLDGAADRESRSGAWTWRFSAGSVRRAFDAGASAAGLLDELRAVATGSRMPQPLEYLIGDVARRHGQILVRPAVCCLRCDDPVLRDEILRARPLANLGLAAISPEVLTSTASVAVTLAALRSAGYAPAAQEPDGTPMLERAPQHRAPGASRSPARAAMADFPEEDLDQLVTALGDEAPTGMLRSLLALQSGDTPPVLTDPEELARKLLENAAGPGPERRRRPGRRRSEW